MTQTEMDAIIKTATEGQLPFTSDWWQPGWNCSGQQSETAKIVTTASGMGVSIGGSIAATLMPAAIPIIGPVVAGVEALIGLFSAILQHHAQAVAREENVLCHVVPALNSSLRAIQNAVADGTLTPQAASGTLDNVVSEFSSAVASIIKNDASHCNAACVWLKCLQAYVIVAKSQYAQQIAQQAAQAATSQASASNAVQQVTATLSATPGWMWLVLGAGALFLVEK
jgi:hypothetical protein